MTDTRHILIHAHIFKNAGTTFDWSLQRCFGDAFLDHRDDAQMKTGAAYLGPFLEANPHLVAVSTHQLRRPMPASAGFRVLPVYLIRHPIDRIGSVYEFERRQRPDTPGARVATTSSFDDYLRWRMQPTSGATIRECHTRFCCLNPTVMNLTDEHLGDAERFLEHEALVGVVDRYDQSMVCFESRLEGAWPRIDLSYVFQNVSKGVTRPLQERIDLVKSRMADEVLELVTDHNQRDLHLYGFANRLLDQRCAEILDFDARLQTFRDRCEALRRL